jgi:uncharacterized protein YxjI
MAADTVPGVDLDAGEYEVEQALIRNKYVVSDSSGKEVLRAAQKLFKAKEEFAFEDPEGNPVFRVKAANLLDVAGDYALETPDGEEIAVLKKNFTFFKHSWTVVSPDGETLAEVRSGSTLLEVLRNVVGLAALIPHRYTIESPAGEDIGEIEGRLSVRDRYALRVGPSDAPAETLVAAAVAIDALEGN